MKFKLNQKGMSLIEAAIVSALGIIILLAAINGMDMIRSQFNRIAKRSLAMSLVNYFSQNLQDQRAHYPLIAVGNNQASYVFCFDQNLKPIKNNDGDLNATIKVLNAAQLKTASTVCTPLTAYEAHLNQIAPSPDTNEPIYVRIVIIGIANRLGLIYDENVAIPEN